MAPGAPEKEPGLQLRQVAAAVAAEAAEKVPALHGVQPTWVSERELLAPPASRRRVHAPCQVPGEQGEHAVAAVPE